MNKRELSQSIAEKTGLKLKDIEKAINAFFDTIKEKVANGEKIQIVGFGTFSQNNRKERTGINPMTKKEIIIPAKNFPSFKPGKDFKTIVNESNSPQTSKCKKNDK